ncbi:Chromatin SPT2 [Penicillium cf. griseofulvum]|uniref:Chromatin SPT2 n=1 Tax=Penicillium cf. griseofulvum TaxID=2972120 RepID=A0A9W9JDQ6_9EURO|nr:Chromatin SPT2 [Penicillium cf. griseofulvum]KAJ5445374.1 Chromatin SPT2 [Penicillium cf. griseofulvum]KAJ5447093.1 Chromatin SPT2 [Penicillium cf. griseofulvum]
MSFLDSVLSSLQTGKPAQLPPTQAPNSPAPASIPKKEDRKPIAVRQAPPTSGNVSGGTKRKAEDQLPRAPNPESRATNSPASMKPMLTTKSAVPSTATKVAPKPASTTISKQAPSKPTSKPSLGAAPKVASSQKAPNSRPTPAVAPTQSKPPPKGSFAEIMAQAKAKQETVPVGVGLLRHQAGPKERLTKVERKRRMMEIQAKEKEARSGRKAGPGVSAKDKSAVRQRDSQEPSYKGTAKPTQTPEPPIYRGTAGLPSNRGGKDRRYQSRNSRQNEYLGTDEEDEGDLGGYDDYYSDASSDMEAGIDDVDREEAAALEYAKREDEKELRAEMAAKKEKLERQRKLAALASRSKR